jgi:hypothetical protein
MRRLESGERERHLRDWDFTHSCPTGGFGSNLPGWIDPGVARSLIEA